MNNVGSEYALIGLCLHDNSVIERVSFLKVDEFYNYVSKQLFKVILDHNSEGKTIDMTVADMLTDVEFHDIADIVNRRCHESQIVMHADIVRDMYNRRCLLGQLSEVTQQLQDKKKPSLNTTADLSKFLDDSILSVSKVSFLNSTQLIEQSIDEMQKSNEGIRVGIKTGIDELDERLGYKHMAFGEVTALGALSKNGKTLTANTIAARADYRDNESCHIFSIEMPAHAMFNGIVSAMSGVPSNFYVKQDFYSTMPQYETMSSQWGNAASQLRDEDRITIDGEKDVDADYICAGMRKQHAICRAAGKTLRLVVVDHFHRMNFDTKGQSMTYAMRDAVRKMKNTAAELDVALLLLVQLNNTCKDKEPTSYDILDSSSVRHELQVFIGTKMYRKDGATYFGIFTDAHRYADMHTVFEPAVMSLVGGVLRSQQGGSYQTIATLSNQSES